MYIFDSDSKMYTFSQNVSSNWAILSNLLLVKITKDTMFMLKCYELHINLYGIFGEYI